MKRAMALLVALVLYAGSVAGQAPDSTHTDSALKSVFWYEKTTTVYRHKTDTLWRNPADTIKPPVDTIKPPPVDTTPAKGVLFTSNWASGDLLDGGKWTRQIYQNVISLVSAAGHGFPAGIANVVRVRMGLELTQNGQTFTATDWLITATKTVNGQQVPQWSVPKVGESRAFRFYFRNENENFLGGWSATHSVESFPNGGSTPSNVKMIAMKFGNDASGTFPWVLATGEAYPKNYFAIGKDANKGTLQKNVTYRLEWKLTRMASGYTLDVRVTDPSGTVVGSASNIYAWGGGTLASSPSVAIADANATALRFGTNGGYSAGSRAPQYFYYGAFMVCADWCGAGVN